MKVTVNNPPVVVSLTLEMTEQEAMALHGIVRRIGGNPEGPRGITDAISQALKSARVKYFEFHDAASMVLPNDFNGLKAKNLNYDDYED